MLIDSFLALSWGEMMDGGTLWGNKDGQWCRQQDRVEEKKQAVKLNHKKKGYG